MQVRITYTQVQGYRYRTVHLPGDRQIVTKQELVDNRYQDLYTYPIIDGSLVDRLLVKILETGTDDGSLPATSTPKQGGEW